MCTTDAKVKALKAKEKSYYVSIDRGLHIRVLTSGTKTWYHVYSNSPKSTNMERVKIGRYPYVSLLDARNKVRDNKIHIQQGTSIKKQLQGTFKEMLNVYFEELESTSSKTLKNVKRFIHKDCSKYYNVLAKDITKAEIEAILRTVYNRGSEIQAKRLRSALNRAFKVGIKHDDIIGKSKYNIKFNIASNPVVIDVQAKENIGTRWLQLNEIASVVNSKKITPINKAKIKIIIATGQRMGEVCFAPISEFDFENKCWTIPAQRTKNKREHVVPLTDFTISLIKSAYALCGSEGLYLFPVHNNPYTKQAPSSHSSLSTNIKVFCKDFKNVFTAKDFRRTVKTSLINMGFDKQDVDKLQNHYKKDVSSTHYDRSDYMHVKMPIMAAWNTKLETIF